MYLHLLALNLNSFKEIVFFLLILNLKLRKLKMLQRHTDTIENL